MRIALFPGSFDPVTLGHVEIVRRGLELFDEIVVAIGINVHKQYLFSLEERIQLLGLAFGDMPRVRTGAYDQLTVDYAKACGARFLLRGLRSGTDLAYEQPVSQINRHLSPELDTVFLHSYPETIHISSTIVREVIKYKGRLDGLLPPKVQAFIEAKRYQS